MIPQFSKRNEYSMLKKTTIVMAVMLLLLLSGCLTTLAPEQTVEKKYECIPPLVESDFSLRVPDKAAYFEQAPLPPWKTVAEEPTDNFARIPVLARKMANGDHEIWFVSIWSTIKPKLENKYAVKNILIYHVEQNQWEKISNYFEGSNLQIFNVYELPSGDLVADGFSLDKHRLGKFDDEKRVFVEIPSPHDFPFGPLIYDRSRQLFWALVPNDGIYSVDPGNGETHFWVSLPNLDVVTFPVYPTAILDAKGDIYFLYNDDNLVSALYKFSPGNNSVVYVYNPIREYYVDPPTTIFLTKNDKLWLDDVGWLDIDKNIWHQVIRSSVFVSNQPENGYTYSWPFGSPMYESSDGLIWFEASNGLISYDVNRDKWCWVTTGIVSSVIEDDENTLWMIAYGKLYKREIP
jgi:hypothetical protein